MLCDLVRSLSLLSQPRADEWDDPEWAWLRRHLQQCVSCQSWWQREQSWDEQLRQALQNVAVPPQLSEQLTARLQGMTQQRWRLRAGVAALAVSLLLAGGVLLMGYYWLFHRSLDLATLQGPILIPDHPSAESIGRLLEQHGVHLPAEFQRRWDFRHLKAVYYTYEQGRWLCNLEFRREDSGAQVVVKLVPRRWCRSEQIEVVRYLPGINVLGAEEDGPFIALVVGDPSHIASFYRPADVAG
ncbi:MAG: hypothetical protein RMJ19_01200 [Gemmatales bacterium]|nr:hypothetical protein [Gemmatales bacterium]MDW8174263.1 hypothetical protein [Gemmatales bacterium]